MFRRVTTSFMRPVSVSLPACARGALAATHPAPLPLAPLRQLTTSLWRPVLASSPVSASFSPLGVPHCCRNIITVNVHAPSAQSGNDFRAEVRRNEEIAAAKFNRMVQAEIKLGVVPPPGRRMKRYSRYVKPKERRRVAGKTLPAPPLPPLQATASSTHRPALRRASKEMEGLQGPDGQLCVLDPVPQETRHALEQTGRRSVPLCRPTLLCIAIGSCVLCGMCGLPPACVASAPRLSIARAASRKPVPRGRWGGGHMFNFTIKLERPNRSNPTAPHTQGAITPDSQHKWSLPTAHVHTRLCVRTVSAPPRPIHACFAAFVYVAIHPASEVTPRPLGRC